MTFGMLGHDESGDEYILLAHETIERVHSSEVSKETLERLHLERFRYEHIRLRGRSPFGAVEEGANPPDFVVSTERGPEAWDVVSFALQDRRLKLDLFDRLAVRLAAGTEGRDFSGLAGSVVSVWFGEDLDALPPKRTDDRLVTPLLDLMSATRIDHEAVRANAQAISREGELPDRIVEGAITNASTSDGSAGFIANVVVPQEESSSLGPLGFHVAPHLPQQVAMSDSRALMQRLVSDHDRSEIEVLLVTAGGPDRHGIRYPSEEVVAALLLESGDLGVSATHLTGAILHLWGAGSVHEIPLRRPPS